MCEGMDWMYRIYECGLMRMDGYCILCGELKNELFVFLSKRGGRHVCLY